MQKIGGVTLMSGGATLALSLATALCFGGCTEERADPAPDTSASKNDVAAIDAQTDVQQPKDADVQEPKDTAPVEPVGSDGPVVGANPNVHEVGNAASGKAVFRLETFGNEAFWTDVVKLPQGVVAAKLTPVQALQNGLSVDVEALDPATAKAVSDEIAAKGATGPLLNDPATTIKLINANAVIGVVAVDSNQDGKIDVAAGDKVGLSCALCHGVTDKSAFDVPTGGSIGKRVDGPAVHNINVGGILAMAANTRALLPMAQLKGADGTSIGRAPSSAGLSKASKEAEFDAYFSNPAFYPRGMFDDTVDGVGNPMHNPPMFRADLAAPWGSAGELSKVDQFSNTVYTVLLDMTTLLTPGGKAFLHAAAGKAGDQMAADYEEVLKETGVPFSGKAFVKATPAGKPGEPDNLVGLRVDKQKLIDMSAYFNSLRSPKGLPGDAAAIANGRKIFRSTGNCTTCHNVDQSKFVPPTIVPLKTIWPGDNPKILAERDPPLNPVQDTPGNTFDDKMIVVNASLRGLIRGSALPLLMDLARKPVFLHDNSVPSLENLLDSTRGLMAPHPFYISDPKDRADVVTFLKSLDDESK